MSILCGTDFSAQATAAAEAAAALAKAWGETLRLIHVLDLFEGDSLPPRALQQLLEQRTQEIEALAKTLAGEGWRVSIRHRDLERAAGSADPDPGVGAA